jgi:hypothetical protein
MAWLVLGAALVLVVATFRDYGVAWDEQGETEYGRLLLRYYASGFRDHSAFEFVNFRFYGGAFELPAAILTRVSPFGEYETRHLWSALLGIGGLAATWRLGRRLGGTRAGVLSALLLILTPSWYGHMFINARDVPFAAGMSCCLLSSLCVLDELPRVRFRTAGFFGFFLGWTMSVRVGGVLSLVFLLIPIALWLVDRARSGVGRRILVRDAGRISGSLLLALIVAYSVIAVFWPWAVQSPLNPLRALLMFSRFPFGGLDLFDGRLIPARSLPASYLPGLLAVKLPATLELGVAGAVLLGLITLCSRPSRLLAGQGLARLTVVLAGAFPILYFVAFRPVDYNGIRHFLFVLPPMAVLAALAFDRTLDASDSRLLRGGLVFGLAFSGVAQLRDLIALHPYEYVYFNRLVGGPVGAQGRYELDYWGTSLAQATGRLVDEIERRKEVPEPRQSPLKVYVCGNVWSAASSFPAWLSSVDRIEDADFQIAIAQFYCLEPPWGHRVLGVTRAGALLSFVDDLRRPSAEHQAKHLDLRERSGD